LCCLCVSQVYNNTLRNWPLLGVKCQLAIQPILYLVKSNLSSEIAFNDLVTQIASQLGWIVLNVPRTSAFGIPCVRSMYEHVAELYDNCTYHGYTNGDILFDDGLARTLHAVAKVSTPQTKLQYLVVVKVKG